MLTLTSIAALIGGFAHYAWMLLLLLVPQVLNVVAPIFTAIVQGLQAVVSAAWEGSKKADRNIWILTAILSAIAFGVGYKYGWNAAIDWGHEHYRWIAKKAITPFWKFW